MGLLSSMSGFPVHGRREYGGVPDRTNLNGPHQFPAYFEMFIQDIRHFFGGGRF